MRSGMGFVLGGIAVGALGLGGGIWYAAGRPIPDIVAHHFKVARSADEAKAEEPRIEVRVIPAAARPVPVAFAYTGTIISPADAELQARVTGTVVERPFEPGGHVNKDQVLFRIDPRPFEVALQAAKAQLEQARAALTFAEAELTRTETLADKGFATEQRFQQLQSNRASAAARLQEAEAAVARQQLNLDYAVVRAPFDGRVSLSLINVGDLVTENQTNLVSVVQVDPIQVQMALSSEDAEAVRRALPEREVTVQLLDAARKPVREAKIDELDNRFDPRTDRRLVRAAVPNADERYLPGQFVRTRVQVGTQERLLVPTISLSSQLDQQIVWTVDQGGTIQLTPVETGDAYGEYTAILKGLRPGMLVATDHLQALRQGMRVNPRMGGEITSIAGEVPPGEAQR